jgi:hypothetical protein
VGEVIEAWQRLPDPSRTSRHSKAFVRAQVSRGLGYGTLELDYEREATPWETPLFIDFKLVPWYLTPTYAVHIYLPERTFGYRFSDQERRWFGEKFLKRRSCAGYNVVRPISPDMRDVLRDLRSLPTDEEKPEWQFLTAQLVPWRTRLYADGVFVSVPLGPDGRSFNRGGLFEVKPGLGDWDRNGPRTTVYQWVANHRSKRISFAEALDAIRNDPPLAEAWPAKPPSRLKRKAVPA